MPKKCKLTLEERKAKAELDQYDIYKLNNAMSVEREICT